MKAAITFFSVLLVNFSFAGGAANHGMDWVIYTTLVGFFGLIALALSLPKMIRRLRIYIVDRFLTPKEIVEEQDENQLEFTLLLQKNGEF